MKEEIVIDLDDILSEIYEELVDVHEIKEEDDYAWAIEPLDLAKYLAYFNDVKLELNLLCDETQTDITVFWRLYYQGSDLFSMIDARCDNPEVEARAKAICRELAQPFRFRVLEEEREAISKIIGTCQETPQN